jgi:hypothetical protein
MKPKFIIVSVCVIIAVAIILILASGSGGRYSHPTGVLYSGTSGTVVVTGSNGIVSYNGVYVTKSTGASQTNITPQTK